MRYRFDMRRKSMSTLLAALLVAALIVPACMTLACTETLMSGSDAMGGMSLSDCLETGVAHDGLLATGSSMLAAIVLFVAMLGFALVVQFAAPLTHLAWVLAPTAAGPPPPLDPRGERLLV